MENLRLFDKFKPATIDSLSVGGLANDESKMEVVKAFNNELVSLYDIKPPISKAKMTAITKAAMKSVKFYKHVVHGVEKFILKCRPDYKIPGLYVIDSIVRQSRHQFGIEKDVFAPRFSKNLLQTFKNICLCPEHDKQKLVRVINLWQKHKVFSEELLKKFLVMAEASEDELPNLYKEEIEAIQKLSKKSPSSNKKKKRSPVKPNTDNLGTSTPVQNSFYSGMSFNVSTLSTNPVSRSLNHNESASKNSVDPAFIQQLQTLTSLLQQSSAPTKNTSPAANGTSLNDQIKFDKKLLEFDYGEEEEEATAGPLSSSGAANATSTDSIASILTNPEIMRQLHTLQIQLSMAQVQAKQLPDQSVSISEQQKFLQNYQMQNQAFAQQQCQQDCTQNFYGAVGQNPALESGTLASVADADIDDDGDDKPEIIMEKHGTDPLEVIDLDHIVTPPSEKSARHSYSRSRSRSPSRSRSRSRRRGRRSRSRSWNRDRSRDREKNEDRRRRALPPVKRKHLAVCSTTLWVGHLSKLVQEQDLSDTFGQFGDIVSIDLIPPRGCAFLCMNRRQDADRALHKLKSTKIQGKAITIAWAPGKGMKGREWKDYWEVDYGVSYIPWNKLTKETDYDLLEEGGMLDQETMPEWLKNLLEEKRKTTYSKSSKILYTPSGTDMDESSNDGDDTVTHSFHNADMVVESVHGASGQSIPLPEGPQPTSDVPAIRIPLPPTPSTVSSQSAPINLPPPANLLNPFSLSPRLLAPMGVLGGNFIPPLGVPPPVPGLLMSPQHMLNRLPPPFPGPPGLPMVSAASAPASSLSQIPLPDSSNAAASSTSAEFKQSFGLAPPILFPGNPNLNIDLPANSNLNSIALATSENRNEDTFTMENENSPIFQNAFQNLLPFGENANVMKKDERNEDTDYRILSDMGGVGVRGAAVNSNAKFHRNVSDGNNDENEDKTNSQRNDGGGGGGSVHYDKDKNLKEFDSDRNYNRFGERMSRTFDRDRDKYNDGGRSLRFGNNSPYRESNFDNDRYKQDREPYRRSRFDNRDYKRGRDFRGGWSRDAAATNRARCRSRERDRFRDARRDYSDNENKMRRFDRKGEGRERSHEENRHYAKRKRWNENNVDNDWDVGVGVAVAKMDENWKDTKADARENEDDAKNIDDTDGKIEGRDEGKNFVPPLGVSLDSQRRTSEDGNNESGAQPGAANEESGSEYASENIDFKITRVDQVSGVSAVETNE